MSLETWIAEFYPVGAYTVKAPDAVAHSLRKWHGLRPDAIARHGLTADDPTVLREEGLTFLEISGVSCALCVVYIDNRAAGTKRCTDCPLVAVLGGKRCDEGDDSPWRQYTYSGDPEPMIAALEAAAKLEAKK